MQTETETKSNNAIQYIYRNTPEVVWNYYAGMFQDELWKLDISQADKNNFRQTFFRYVNGERNQRALQSLNYYIWQCIEKTFPIADNRFFIGGEETIKQYAQPTCDRMVEDFERILENQKKQLVA